MLRFFRVILLLPFLSSCSDYQSNDTTEILKEIIKNELSSDLNSSEKTFIYFLQNAECKCSEETLNQIRDFDKKRGNLIVVVNKKSHFAVSKLKIVKDNLKYIGINTLLSYGFLQDKDILVEIQHDRLSYINL